MCRVVRGGAQAALHGWTEPLVREQQAGRSRRAQAVDARGTSNAALGGAQNGQSQPMDTGGLARRGWNRTAVANKNARIVWALLRRGGVYGESASESGEHQGGINRAETAASDSVVKSFPRKKAGQCQGRGKRQEVEVSCRTMRGVIEVMTREVRPASPEPVHVKGL